MNIHGKEYHFAGTVEAIERLGRLCPGGDISNMEAYLDSANVSESIEFMRGAVLILNNAYADYCKEWEGEEVPRLTSGQVKTLTMPALQAATQEALKAMTADAKSEVEITAKKKTSQ